jgi:hypothetical protein
VITMVDLTEAQARALDHAREVLAELPDNTMALRLALRDLVQALDAP